jgi:hypothetical protein
VRFSLVAWAVQMWPNLMLGWLDKEIQMGWKEIIGLREINGQ